MKRIYLILGLLMWAAITLGQKPFPGRFSYLLSADHQYPYEQQYYLLASDAPYKKLTDNKRFQVIKKLANGYYIIRISPSLSAHRRSAEGILWPVNDHWKESEIIAKSKSNAYDTYIIRGNCDDLEEQNSAIAIRRVKNLPNTYLVEGKLNDVRRRFLNKDCVTYIGKESFSPISEALVNDLDLTHNRISSIHQKYPLINGNDLIISIKENQFDTDDIDLLGKNIPSGISSENVDNHATEMATIIAGTGNSFITGKGIAHEARLSSSDFSDIVPDTDAEYQNLSIDAQNHSYGTVIENFYGTLAEAYDVSSFNNPEILHVFSAGNIGASTSMAGPYAGIEGYANLTGNFKSSKNTLSVGSVDEEGDLLTFSSKGPAFDGRVKPELVAYSKFGTSNSAAIVTGLGALLNQRFREEYNDIPSAALLKALMINSAVDVEAKGVDYRSGYGNLNGERALENLMAGQFENGEIANDQQITYDLEVPAGAKNLKVTLTWTDSASSAGSIDVLINDLDLKVLANGTEWMPWVLNPAPGNLADLPTRGVDHLNVIEQITIEDLPAGSYQIVVEGFDVVSTSQSFAIAWQYDMADQFGWSHPVKNDNLPYVGENAAYLQWNSTFDETTTGDLFYTIDDGQNWIEIARDVKLSDGHHRWEDYPTDFTLSKMKMTINGTDYLSEQFTISLPKRINVGFECGDSLLFFWRNESNATSFNIYNLPDDELTVFSNTTDTSLLINKNDFVNNFLAIEPVYDGIKGMRSFTINYQLQGASCYFTSIFPEAFPDEDKILLTTFIGTTYNIDKIVIERFDDVTFTEIGSISPDGLELVFEDTAPRQGINIYRAIAILNDGSRVSSLETDIFYLTTREVMVFPNPVKQNESLAVFIKNVDGEEVVFELYNTEGKRVLRKEILTDRDSYTTAGLNQGLYIYRVYGAGINRTGKIIID